MKKSQEIYQYIRQKGAVSKQDIVIDLRFSLPTITQNLQYLVELGTVDASKKFPGSGERGRNATAYSFVREARAAIGVYLTGHYISSVAVDLAGGVMKAVRERIEFDLESDSYLKKIGDTVEKTKIEAKIRDENLLGVGISVPGLVSEDGSEVIYGQTLGFTGKKKCEIARYIPYETRLFHDSSAAGYAEVWVSPGIYDAFYISLSNSVGGAAVIDRNIYEGSRQKAGEVGHMTVVPEGGEQCYCGRSGCFDTVCRSTNLDRYTDGKLDAFFSLLEEGDQEAEQLWDNYLTYLALGIHNVRMLFDSPIIIGGYVGAYIERYMDDLCERVDSRDSFGEKSREYLMPCKYKVESAAAGAAIFFIDRFFEWI